ncbi:MAG: N-acetylmuramoyl-L-alanine amidase [Proteobacteria bacterium]|nr:N-acetylmuramoyl-L-alanine amidase [Pseudomonadota bacterium]
MTDKTIDRPSPNFDTRSGPVDMIVLHYTGMKDCAAALDRLCDPTAKVSAHYLIDEDGTLYTLVEESMRAWHAGVACWHGQTNINGCSIGIELVNPGHEFGYRVFPESQMLRLEQLCRDIVQRHDISAARVLGHADVAPMRKQDPGELFDWRRMAAAGLALWPDVGQAGSGALRIGDANQDVVALQTALGSVGYRIAPDGAFGTETEAVVTAFQRHYRPRAVDGVADTETLAMLDGLASLFVDL